MLCLSRREWSCFESSKLASGRDLKDLLSNMATCKSLKEQLDKLEASFNLALESIKERLSGIEISCKPEDKKEIVNHIDATKIEITNSNNKIAQELKEDILQIKDVVIENLRADNLRLRERVSVLENTSIENERRLNLMDQHSRKVNMEIDGIPDSVKQDDLKPFVVDIFSRAGITEACTGDIEVVH